MLSYEEKELLAASACAKRNTHDASFGEGFDAVELVFSH